MNLYYATKYLYYNLFSSHKKGHGIHSPFVFHLITKVFRNKINPDVVFNIEKIRQMMISDKRRIIIKDYGSGPEGTVNTLRIISEIVKYSTIPQRYGFLLASLSREFGKSGIVAMGTSLGISTLYMAAGSPDVTVHSINGYPEISEIAKDYILRSGLKNISLYTDKFDEVLAEIVNKSIKPGLVYINGDNRKEKVLKYFYTVAEMGDKNSVLVLDDINRSAEMGEAWKEIKKYEKVTLTVDIFRMGLVFFREGVSRYDYIIRY
jgi:predicted O-methyltransferase YrrM